MRHDHHSAVAVPWGLVLVACVVLAVTFGTTMTRGLFLSPINTATGVGIVSISFAAAVAQLMWGAWQPVWGALADRYGAAVVIVIGGFVVHEVIHGCKAIFCVINAYCDARTE